jgi:hypothetical protein
VVVAVVVGITQVAQCKAQVVLEEVAVARLEQEHHLLLVRLALLTLAEVGVVVARVEEVLLS